MGRNANKTVPKPARSKNGPDGRRSGPQADWPAYDEGRRSGGQLYVRWMPMVADGARHIMGMPQGGRGRRVPAMPAGTAKSEEGASCWGLVKHFDKHPGDLKRRELYGPYSRAQCRPYTR